jgi:DNA-binding response OmpR family regulator
MGQAGPVKPIALIVEDDELQRQAVAVLLEESGMGVIQCESAEAAWRVLERIGGCVSMMFTGVNLLRAIQSSIGEGLRLQYELSQELPDQMVTALNQEAA